MLMRSQDRPTRMSVFNIGPPRNGWAFSILDLARPAIHGNTSLNRPGIAGGSGLPQVERRRITGFCCHNREGGRYGKERLLVGVSTAGF
jgi:hypothetical protein